MYVTSLMAQKHFLNIKIVFVYNTLHYIGQTHLRKICYIIIKVWLFLSCISSCNYQ